MGKDLSNGFADVRVGMTLDEVVALMGPAGHHGSQDIDGMIVTGEGASPPGEHRGRVWTDDNHMFEVYFNPAGNVVGKHRRIGYSPVTGSSSE